MAIGKYYQDARQKVLKYFKERLGTIPPEPGQRQEILDEIPAWVINELHHHFVSVTELLRLSNRKMERRKVRGMADELKEKGIPVGVKVARYRSRKIANSSYYLFFVDAVRVLEGEITLD